jgi:hypothetical protein
LQRLIVSSAVLIVAVCLAVAFWPRRPGPAPPRSFPELAGLTAEPSALTPAPSLQPPRLPAGGCEGPPAMRAAAADNAASLTTRAWSPWGRAETGWEIYAPMIAAEAGSACGPATPGFAEALARWQQARKLPPTGVMTPETFEVMRVAWLKRRPFVIAYAGGQCPVAADEALLVDATKAEGYSGKPIKLLPQVLQAYRAMVAAAKADLPAEAEDPRFLTIFSGYRAPADDEERCDQQGDCGTIAKARCSAHRTGTALDMFVGFAPGSRPESSDDFNRLHQSRTPAYLWLVSNARRFGFVPYPFEPWHWEWAGAARPG